MRSLAILALLTAILAVTPVVASSDEPGPITTVECGELITRDVVLQHDMVCPPAPFPQGAFFSIDAPEGTVTVDLNGHRLQSTRPSFGGIVVHATETYGLGPDVIIENGALVGAGIVEFAEYADIRVEGVEVRDAGPSILLYGSGDDRILRNRVIDGNIVIGAGVVAGNRVIGGSIEIDNFDWTSVFTIAFNSVSGSPRGGIIVHPLYHDPDDLRGTIAANALVGNAGPGIHLHNDLQTAGRIDIAHNLVAANGGDGIAIIPNTQIEEDPVGPFTLTSNLALFNRGHGINVDWLGYRPSPVVDGGHNVAVLNGQHPPCIGVRCVGPLGR